MRLLDSNLKGAEYAQYVQKGYEIPSYFRDKMIARTKEAPTWVHFGAGNIFRAFPAAKLDDLMNQGKYDKGVIICESYDDELIDQIYRPYDNLCLSVVLKADGSIEKKVVGSIAESLVIKEDRQKDLQRVEAIFKNPSLQMVSFTITEKGYAVLGKEGEPMPLVKEDLTLTDGCPKHLMGIITCLLYERFKANHKPIALVSMDNCSRNGEKVKEAIFVFAKGYVKNGRFDSEFLTWLDEKVSYPWTMIDKITPRPDATVQRMLKEDGFTDTEIIVTNKNTYAAPFVNSEEVGYLVIEDDFPNGRPPLEQAGFLFTDRATVEKTEQMKVCTCLNPLHTALAIFGCLLNYQTIHEEMENQDLKEFITKMGYQECMPVVTNPGILQPEEFIYTVIEKRLPNVFMPDSPWRIACDTSQKLPIRFGRTLTEYIKHDLDLQKLTCIPFVIAGYARYLTGINDVGEAFTICSDPMLPELTEYVKGYQLGKELPEHCLREFLSRRDLFGVDLVKEGLEEKIESYFNDMMKKPGAVKLSLAKVLEQTSR